MEALLGEPNPTVPHQGQDKSGEERGLEIVALEGQCTWVDISPEPSKLGGRPVGCDGCDDLWAKAELWGQPPPSKCTSMGGRQETLTRGPMRAIPKEHRNPWWNPNLIMRHEGKIWAAKKASFGG